MKSAISYIISGVIIHDKHDKCSISILHLTQAQVFHYYANGNQGNNSLTKVSVHAHLNCLMQSVCTYYSCVFIPQRTTHTDSALKQTYSTV